MKEQSLQAHRYVVVAGSHYEGKKEYKKGDVLVSNTNMVELFPGKFTDLGLAEAPATAPVLVTQVAPPDLVVKEEVDWAAPVAPEPTPVHKHTAHKSTGKHGRNS